MIQTRSHRYARRRAQPMSEINVTPFVDVMLVLLVIFMVTAPLLTVGVKVDLPKSKAGAVTGSDEPLAISINREGQVFIQDTLTGLDGLVPKLIAISTVSSNFVLLIAFNNDTASETSYIFNLSTAFVLFICLLLIKTIPLH